MKRTARDLELELVANEKGTLETLDSASDLGLRRPGDLSYLLKVGGPLTCAVAIYSPAKSSQSTTVFGILCLKSYAKTILSAAQQISEMASRTKKGADQELELLPTRIRALLRCVRSVVMEFSGRAINRAAIKLADNSLYLHNAIAVIIKGFLSKYQKRIDSICVHVPASMEKLDGLNSYLLRDENIKNLIPEQCRSIKNPFNPDAEEFFRVEIWESSQATQTRLSALQKQFSSQNKSVDYAHSKLSKIGAIVFSEPFVLEYFHFELNKLSSVENHELHYSEFFLNESDVIANHVPGRKLMQRMSWNQSKDI